MTANFNKEIN